MLRTNHIILPQTIENKACKIGKLWTEPIGSGISTKLKSIKTYLIDKKLIKDYNIINKLCDFIGPFYIIIIIFIYY